jgi:hypothetical protein
MSDGVCETTEAAIEEHLRGAGFPSAAPNRDLATVQLLVANVLENADRVKWSLQGLGMLRTYLSKAVRLHIWDDRFAVHNVSTLHNHPWSFESLVVCGAIRNRIYRSFDHLLTKTTHHEQKIQCGTDGKLIDATKRDVHLELQNDYTVTAGWSYRQPHDAIHDTIAARGTVTIVHRRFHADTEHARVYFPLGTDWVAGIPRPATPAEVATIVEGALQRLHAE